jgi:hypothetical protein
VKLSAHSESKTITVEVSLEQVLDIGAHLSSSKTGILGGSETKVIFKNYFLLMKNTFSLISERKINRFVFVLIISQLVVANLIICYNI